MQNIIIGTAGHVDHGKTCLIKALSGIDTDRLKEEKKRGITIENGYAHIKNDLGIHLGIIDVPGHEKFVKNMLAGIGGIDIVLLVISLEEGIKPQTVEHFEIIKSLGIKKGIIVFTKLDLENKVDFDNLKNQVKDLVKGSFLENADMICVSSYTGKNIDLLKDKIFELAESDAKRNEDKNLARLPIDRVFTMEGFGTVITGTLMEGKIDTGDELMLYPSERVVKVRQIESHGKVEPSAFAGQRTAINLLNIKKEDINRGDVIAAKSSIVVTDLIDCKLIMFKSSSRVLKKGEKVHFNFGAKQTEATVRLLIEDTENASNASFNEKKFYVQLKFDSLIPVKIHDKYIIRFLSPEETCGGGIILNVFTKKYKPDEQGLIAHFKRLDSGDDSLILKEIIDDLSVEFLSLDLLAKIINKSLTDTISLLNKIDGIYYCNKKDAVCDSTIVLSDKFSTGIKKYISDILSKFHKDNAMSFGMKKEELKSILFKRYNKAGDTTLEALLDSFIKDKIIKQKDDLIANIDFNVVIDDKKAGEINSIEKKYLDAGFEPPDTQSVVDDYAKGKAPSLKLEARQILVDLAKSGKLEKLSPDYYIHRTFYDKAVDTTIHLFDNTDKIQMKDVRDALKTSRKYAILLVDHFDQRRLTKTVGDYRILLKK